MDEWEKSEPLYTKTFLMDGKHGKRLSRSSYGANEVSDIGGPGDTSPGKSNEFYRLWLASFERLRGRDVYFEAPKERLRDLGGPGDTSPGKSNEFYRLWTTSVGHKR